MLEIPFLKVACEKAKSDFEFFGANAPYVGSADGTPLNNFICQNAGKPSVVLLDEFDKTVNTVWLRALNIFEKGEWEDTRSRKPVNCSKTGIMFFYSLILLTLFVFSSFHFNCKLC